MRVAIVHDWLTGMRGGEIVLEAIVDLFPSAELFTLIHVPGSTSPKIEALKIHTSFLQKIPNVEKNYRYFLPLMPKAIESFDLSGFDLILSSSHCVAKGIRKPKSAFHASYIHAPMRYIWDRFDDYFGPDRGRPLISTAARLARPVLQRWDKNSSRIENVDVLMANSHFIADRIQEFYGRHAEVVHPFADLSRFKSDPNRTDDYLIVGAFAPYKRIDLAIEAFNEIKRPLKIIGSGQDEKHLRDIAAENIEFLGSLSNAEVARRLSTGKAFIYPGVEDFGITAVEALASGTPLIAYGAGGALDIVADHCGVLFKNQTRPDLIRAVLEFESHPDRWSREACVKRAQHFSRSRFQREFLNVLLQGLSEKPSHPLLPEIEPLLSQY